MSEAELLFRLAEVSPLVAKGDESLWQSHCLLSVVVHLKEASKDSQKSASAAMALSAVDKSAMSTITLDIWPRKEAYELLEALELAVCRGDVEIGPASEMKKSDFTLCNNVISTLWQLLNAKLVGDKSRDELLLWDEPDANAMTVVAELSLVLRLSGPVLSAAAPVVTNFSNKAADEADALRED